MARVMLEVRRRGPQARATHSIKSLVVAGVVLQRAKERRLVNQKLFAQSSAAGATWRRGRQMARLMFSCCWERV